MKSAKIYRVSLGSMGNVGFMICLDETGKPIGFFVTGQLPDRTNPPAGKYVVNWVSMTPNHPTGVFMLQNVPGHTNVEMHNGDYFGDVNKGFRSDVLGCTLVASSVGMLGNQIVIENSKTALAQFDQLMGPETFELEIIDGGALLNV